VIILHVLVYNIIICYSRGKVRHLLQIICYPTQVGQSVLYLHHCHCCSAFHFHTLSIRSSDEMWVGGAHVFSSESYPTHLIKYVPLFGPLLHGPDTMRSNGFFPCYSSFFHVFFDGLATIVVMGDCLWLFLGRADPLSPSHASDKEIRLILIDKR
jgi:hypothetical protein